MVAAGTPLSPTPPIRELALMAAGSGAEAADEQAAIAKAMTVETKTNPKSNRAFLVLDDM